MRTPFRDGCFHVTLTPLVTPRPLSVLAYFVGMATCALTGGLFVYVGHRVAPRWRLPVAVVLTVLTAAVALVTSLQFAFGNGSGAAAIGGIWMLLGGAIGALPLIDLDSHPGADDELATATEMNVR